MKRIQIISAFVLALTLACGLIPNSHPTPVNTSNSTQSVSTQFADLFPSQAPTPISTTTLSLEPTPVGAETTGSEVTRKIQFIDIHLSKEIIYYQMVNKNRNYLVFFALIFWISLGAYIVYTKYFIDRKSSKNSVDTTNGNVSNLPVGWKASAKVNSEEISKYANYYNWDRQGNLIYSDFSKGKIFKWNKRNSEPLGDFSSYCFGMYYYEDGNSVYCLEADGPEAPLLLYQKDLKTNEEKQISDYRMNGVFIWDPTQKSIWGYDYTPAENRDPELWKINPGGEIKYYSLPSVDLSFFVDAVFPFVTDQYTITHNNTQLVLWDLPTKQRIEVYKDVTDPYVAWVSNEVPEFVFVDKYNRLNIATPSNNWKASVLLPDIKGPIVFVPSSIEIAYMSYNPERGGHSFWAVNINSGKIRLLSEAILESGRVKTFKISPDGKTIAFVNEENTLYIINTGK